MFNPRVLTRISDITLVLAVFFMPLLFFIDAHDQFELPKLTFLALLVIPRLLLTLSRKDQSYPLLFLLLLLVLVQALASSPWVSSSWKTSLLGDYDNFSGLVTLLLYFFWFITLDLNERLVEKTMFFSLLSGFFLSVYAVFQHFGIDFIQWNPDTINSAREFGSLGNPNFLAAYLAMVIPFGLYQTIKNPPPTLGPPASSRLFPWFFFLLGLGLLVLSSAWITHRFQVSDDSFFPLFLRALGLALLSIGFVKISLRPSLWISFLTLLTLLFGLSSTASRGGFLAALVGVLLFLWLITREKEKMAELAARFRNILDWKWGTALLLVLLCLGYFSFPFLVRLAHSTAHTGESLATSRLHIWRPALKMVEAKPWLGVGLDTFKIAFPFYSGIEFNHIDGMFMSSRTAHNELLQMAATTGLVGLAAYLSVIGGFFTLWLLAFRRSGSKTRLLLAAILASAAAYHVQNLFSFDVAAISFLWFVLLAMVGSLGLKPSRSSPFLHWVLALLMVLFLVYALIFPLQRLGADIAFAKASSISEFLKKPDPDAALSGLMYYSEVGIGDMEKAVRLCPWDVKYRLYEGLSFEQRAPLDKDHAKECLTRALQSYQTAAQMSPANAYYFNDQGRVCQSLMAFDPSYLPLAERAYRNAVLLAPASPFFIVNHALVLGELGRTDESKKILDMAFALDPNFTSNVLDQMAVDHFQKGDKEKAYDFLSQSIQGNTANAVSYYYRGLLLLLDKRKKAALEDLLNAQRLRTGEPAQDRIIQNLDDFIHQAKS